MSTASHSQTATESAIRYHVLLAGVDAYHKAAPLSGCVNDADALEALFLDRLAVPPSSLTKLVAPHRHAARTPRVSEGIPTSANLRSALERLAGDEVRPGDRVFVHFSGHGTQLLPRGSRLMREALLPVDALVGGAPLFDYELNDLFRRIAARTEDLTIVLDCCCSAGATRSAFRAPESALRFFPIDDSAALSPNPPNGDKLGAGLFSTLDPADPGFLVVASAQSSEAANEGFSANGARHGAFTAALLDLLAQQTDERLRSLRWVDLWQPLRARLASTFPGQRPCLLGRGERRLFGGPFRKHDPGIPISEVDGRIRLHAGSLAGLGPGALVAVYGPEPAFFPPLHSAEDLAARFGLLRVEQATATSAVATPVGPSPRLVPGARARLVNPGKGDALVVGLLPFDAALARWLSAEVPFRIVDASRPGECEMDLVVGRSSHGRFWMGDEVFGEDAPLAWVEVGDRAGLLRGLLHYARYGLPLRLARRSRDLPGALHLRVLDARAAPRLGLEELGDPPLPEVGPDPERRYRYQLVDRQPICLSVENRSSLPLYVQILNCSASGRVEVLGPTQLEIAPQRRHAFWRGGRLGDPFLCQVSAGRASNVERLVVVGTRSPEVDLRALRVKESFGEEIAASRRGIAPETREPADLWTATSVSVRIVRGE